MLRCGFVVCALLLVHSSLGADDAKDLQGTWDVVSSVRDGKDNPEIKEDKLVIDANKLTVKRSKGGNEEPITFKLDASKKPKQIDVEAPNGSISGIYELQGGTLKIAFSKPGTERPTEFASKEGSGVMFITLKKGK